MNVFFVITENYSHFLIFWPSKDSATSVKNRDILPPRTVGEDCIVMCKGKRYEGMILAGGKYITYNKLSK